MKQLLLTVLCWPAIVALTAFGTLSKGQLNDHSALLDSAEAILARVAEIRELEVRTSVRKGVRSREQVRAYLKDRVAREYPRDQIELEGRVLRKLGLIPAEMDLYEFTLELLSEQVAGYYDPHQKTLYLADWIPLEIQKPVMAHELTHALQDQYFDLRQYISRIEGNDDKMLARSALIEGEGLAIMLEYSLQPFGRRFVDLPDVVALNQAQISVMNAQFPLFAAAPAFLKESLLFPYTFGGRFIQAYLQVHTWGQLNRLYEDLPESTEQILHPEKYLENRDRPSTVPAQVDLKGGWQQVYRNVLGEFSLYLLVRQFTDQATARTASEGWDGDVVLLQERESDQALILSSVWDSQLDAREFADAYRQVVAKKYPNASLLSNSEPNLWQWESPTDSVQVSWRDRSVEIREIEK